MKVGAFKTIFQQFRCQWGKFTLTRFGKQNLTDQSLVTF